MKSLLCLTGVLLLAIATYAQDCNLNEDARRYWVRAQAALKDAKSESDYLSVCEEFKKVLKFAPDCSDIYFNIGMCYDKSSSSGLVKDIWGCGQAIEYFKKYIELKPDAQNKREVQDKIYELEFKYDKLYKSFPFLGKYNISGISGIVLPEKFEIMMDNNLIMAIVPQNNMGANDTLMVENYKTTEGKEYLRFCQKEYVRYSYNEKKNTFDYKNYVSSSDICYYLTFKGVFALEYSVDIAVCYNNNKPDIKVTQILNGLDGHGQGWTKRLLKASKITKIE